MKAGGEKALLWADAYQRARVPESGPVSAILLHELKSLLDSILPKNKQPILGSLPYRHLNYPARLPVKAPAVEPAYRGGAAKTAMAADLAGSPDAPVSLAIASLAESLHWNPVEIYEWVKNNIKTEWYWGLMKGAEETLAQKAGNDADQAALLVALLRSAGYPAHFVTGVIEFFPGIQAAYDLTGIRDIQELALFFQKAGIPYEPVIGAGRLSNLRIGHVWVEAEIPYDNYRGAVLDTHGPTWLGLDTSIKVLPMTENTPAPIPASLDFDNLRHDYLSQSRSETPLQYLG